MSEPDDLKALAMDAIASLAPPAKHSQTCPVWTGRGSHTPVSQCSCWVRQHAERDVTTMLSVIQPELDAKLNTKAIGRSYVEMRDFAARETTRADRAEAERDRFAEALHTQIHLHASKPRHEDLAHRVCQTCATFRELRDLPAIRAAEQRLMGAISEALRTGNYVACEPPEDRIERGEL